MKYVLLMKIINANRRLEEENKGFFLRKFSSLSQIMKKRTFLSIFQYQVNVLCVFEIMKKLNDIGVFYPFLKLYFPFYIINGSVLDN